MSASEHERPPKRSLGTRSDRRTQLPWPETDFRILSIDGGGIRGILPAAVLAECERRFLDGAPATPYFDLVAGTSTGGIVALGLASGMSAQRILDQYLYRGGDIFPRTLRRRRTLHRLQCLWRGTKGLFVARYDGEALAELLNDILEDRLFGEASVRLVVPTFDRNEEVNVFKTPHHPDYRLDWKEKMTTVARATSAAPTFLPVFTLGARSFGDGGVWANDPVMLGLVDALACYDVDRQSRHPYPVARLRYGNRPDLGEAGIAGRPMGLEDRRVHRDEARQSERTRLGRLAHRARTPATHGSCLR